MIKIEKPQIMNICRAVYSARNAMNSWDRSDSNFENDVLGENDLKLAKQLCKAGTDHRKFMRMIVVYADITAPRYWWTEYDTYKIGTVANSCSTMHKIHAKEFTIDDFSHEHLSCLDVRNFSDGYPLLMLQRTIKMLNECMVLYSQTNDKSYWWQMIQLLPQSYNQKRTVMLNYEVLTNMYKSRKNHKLDEWRTFCKWIEGLPYSELITGDDENGNT